MLRDLPEPRHDRLPQAPVELAVWQLQFAEPVDIVSPTVGTRLAECLSDEHGPFQLQRLNALPFQIALPSPLGQPGMQLEPAQGWILRRGGVAVTANRQALSVETNLYETYSDLRVLIERAIAALSDSIILPGEQRLGLRYVDRISRPGVRRATDWTNLLEGWLVGPLAHPQLGDAVGAYAQQVDFQPDAQNIRATLRQRVFPDPEQRGRQTVILDFDVFREGYRLVELDETLAATDQMNDTAHRLFEASVTEPLYAAFAAEPEEA